jgi:ammonium transporter, Amt family
LRVTSEQEEAGLDIVEHGMYGYPELFIPDSDGGSNRFTPDAAPAPAPTAMGGTTPRPATIET